MRPESANPAGQSGARPGTIRCAHIRIVPQWQDAGILDLRSEVAALDSYELRLQLAWLIEAPLGIRHLPAPRLHDVLAELQDCAARVEAAP
jgi:hypothetical protein